MRIPGSKAAAVTALIEWAREHQAFPEGTPGGEGRGHIDENHRFKLRDMMAVIDYVPPTTNRERILKVLEAGPTDSGTIANAVGMHRADVARALHTMREQGRCERVDPGLLVATWALTRIEADHRKPGGASCAR